MDTLKKVGENGDIGPRHDARSSSKRGAADGVGAQMKKVGEKLGKKGRGDVSPQVEERSVAGNILRVEPLATFCELTQMNHPYVCVCVSVFLVSLASFLVCQIQCRLCLCLCLHCGYLCVRLCV